MNPSICDISNWLDRQIEHILKYPKMYGISHEAVELQLLQLHEVFGFIKNKNKDERWIIDLYFEIIVKKYKKRLYLFQIVEDTNLNFEEELNKVFIGLYLEILKQCQK